jgi:Skp family chaperone for outer membrane proteins
VLAVPAGRCLPVRNGFRLKEERMKTLKLVLVAVVALAFGASCAKKATPAECKAACEKKVGFQKPAQPPEDPVQKVEQEFQQKIQQVQQEQAQAIQAVNQELQQKLQEAKDDKAKEALNEEYNKKRQEVAAQFQPKFQEIAQQKAQALQAAQEQKAKAEAEAKAALEQAIQDCADQCVKQKWTKAKVDCQMKAADLAAFEKCK